MSRSVRGPDYGLQVYEKHPAADAYRVGPGFTGYAILAVEKRFTDAELASEYWRSVLDLASPAYAGFALQHVTTDEMCETLERFATLPHFD